MTKIEESPDDSRSRESFAVVGELVMISTALDFLLNRALITMLNLGEAILIEPVVATLDTARKLEILKARANQMPTNEWKNGVTKFCDQVDKVFKQRNIACHTPAILKNDVWTFQPIAAAKMFKNINLVGKTIRSSSIDDFKQAITTGEAALSGGLNLIENFKRFNIEVKRREATKSAAKK